ncbi:LuxR family transcriptional regulator [Nitrosovibrio sp. Nv4]|uniref:LuxR family transcriptional regulator n=1 Tax=Nitrosovibrio sp. Nv4 TaxID=1945880 RepID=UPI000BCD3A8D|nr:LuxR family transcriptional regulator [Nitrosovibrio sp. Nv4]SOD39866.1 LuxR family transcriptional regulator, transcriptional activator of the bioluminescence operon [Nitrosovibrio sp. Nv4]
MNNLNLFESLLNCETVEELHASTTAIARQMGFEHFLYGVQVNTSLTRPYRFILSCYPEAWRKHYDEAGYANIDPTVSHCARTSIPIIWKNEIFKGRKEARVRSEARDCGLVSGASFSVHGGHGETAMLSLATARESREAQDDIIEMMGKAQLLTCYLQEAVQRIVLSKGPVPLKRISLTEREKECLLWAAEGKTGWEIANIVSISERTVTFHLQNAAQKMGVVNRQQAISRALSMGLIEPQTIV